MDSDSSELGTCEKCATDIPADAERCPQCGHEPSNLGTGLRLLSGVCILYSLILALPFVAAWIAALATDFAASDALFVSVWMVALFLPAGLVLYAIARKESAMPTGERGESSDTQSV